jgi:hypothetical protein
VSTDAARLPGAAWQPGAYTRFLPRSPAGARLVVAFVVFQLACQVMLLSTAIGQVRVLVRLAAFSSSLALLLLVRGRGGPHPAVLPAALVVGVLFISFLHPETAGIPAGGAHAALYLAVLAPVFWLPRLNVDVAVLRRVVTILWVYHSVGAAVGVLQVYMPGVLQPALSTVIASKGESYVRSLEIVTATGARVFRPMGLTDVPGGASIHGLYAVLFAMGFFLTRRTPLMWAATLASMTVGIACLYLSQVRAVLVMTVVSAVVMCVILAWRRDVGRLVALGGALAVVGVVGLSAARDLVGPMATQRMATLVQQPASQVYYDNRGRFLEDAVMRQLPKAPFGEGLGHWGMPASYFGQYSHQRKPIWVEIQWAAWIVDGGLPLLLSYLALVALALLMAARIARGRPPSRAAADLPFWGAVVLAYGVGTVALSFSYPIFVSQAGMEFWTLNALLFVCARRAALDAAAARAPVPAA